jgi:hypothetical protein
MESDGKGYCIWGDCPNWNLTYWLYLGQISAEVRTVQSFRFVLFQEGLLRILGPWFSELAVGYDNGRFFLYVRKFIPGMDPIKDDLVCSVSRLRCTSSISSLVLCKKIRKPSFDFNRFMDAVNVKSDKRTLRNKSKSSNKFPSLILSSPSSLRNVSKVGAGPSELRAAFLGQASDKVAAVLEFEPFQMGQDRVAVYDSGDVLLGNDEVKAEVIQESVSDTLPADKTQPPSF